MKDQFIVDLYKLADSNRIETATDLIYQHIDDLLLAGEFEVVNELLDKIIYQKIPRSLQRSILVITAPAKDKLCNREDFWHGVYMECLFNDGVELADRLFGSLK